MYIFISDRFLINDKTLNYFTCKGDYLTKAIAKCPVLETIESNEIDKVIVYSFSKEHNDFNALESDGTKNYECKNGLLKLYYNDFRNLETTCSKIRAKLYGLLKRRGLLQDDNNTPFIFACDINDYNAIMDVKSDVVVGIINEIEQLKQQKDWQRIANYWGDCNNIEKLECWGNITYLAEVAYALSKITEPGYKNLSYSEKQSYEHIFVKVIEKCLQVEPQNQTFKSIKAYHYYNIYLNGKSHNAEAYDIASFYYQDLIMSSSEKFKEEYRYFKLKQFNFGFMKFTLGDKWYATIKENLTNFELHINSFEDLNELQQKKYRKEFVGSLYAYSVLVLDDLLNVWDRYVENQLYSEEIPEYIFNQENLLALSNADKFINRIIENEGYENGEQFDLSKGPHAVDVYYRLAQIEQFKGLYHLIKDGEKGNISLYFENSTKYIKRASSIARNSQRKVLTHHLLPIRMRNDFLLGKNMFLSENWKKDSNYVQYERAVILHLQGNFQKAKEAIFLIPKNDKCFAKAQKLLEKITNEQR